MKRMTPEEAREWRKKSALRYQETRQKPARAPRKPVTPQQARKRAEDAEYRVNREKRLVQARGRCEFKEQPRVVDDSAGIPRLLAPPRCPRAATQTHHIVRRSQHVDHSVENLRALCLDHHQWLHLNVELAEEWGWIKSDHPQIGEPLMES